MQLSGTRAPNHPYTDPRLLQELLFDSCGYIQLYNSDKKTLIESLERIQKTASEILEAVMIDKESECKTTGVESRVAVAA